MTRITVDINDDWLAGAQEILGTPTKVATINAALQALSQRRDAVDLMAALAEVEIDVEHSPPWRYGGGRDLESLEAKARRE